MSALMRMACRIAVVEILRADPVIATATGGRVYDSEMVGIDSAEPVPVLIVHTESDQGEAWSANNGGPPFDLKAEIVIEIVHAAKGEQDGEAGLFLPVTTRELEAALDALEWRIPDAIAFAETPLATALRLHVLKRISAKSSDRFASDDIGARLASRVLTLTVELNDEEQRVYRSDDDLPSGDFANLPEPLRTLAPLFEVGSSARQVMEMVAAKLPPAASSDDFDATDITIDVAPDGLRPPAP